MTDSIRNFVVKDEDVDKGERIQRLLYRIVPFWPILILFVIAGLISARLYLRYKVPVYSANARLNLNDDSEQKGIDLQEIFKVDSRNLSIATEKEVQIIQSRDLFEKLVVELQLNIIYSQKGRLRSSEYYENELPFKLVLEKPQLVQRSLTGIAELSGDKITFNNETFPLDSMVPSQFGNIKWVKNQSNYVKYRNLKKVEITIFPVRSAVVVLDNNLKVQPISKQSSIVDLTYSDVIPARAVSILTNLVSIYGQEAIEYKSRIFENAQRFLDGRLRIVSDELNGVEKNLQSFKTTQGIVDLSAEGNLYLSQVKETDRKIAELDVQMDVLNQVNAYVRRRNNTGDSVPATLGITDVVLTGLLNQLFQAETDLTKMRELSGSKNPQVEVYQEVIEKLRPGIINSINNLKINLTASRNRLEAEANKMSGILTKIPAKERIILDITRQQSIKNAIYTFLLQKREESAISSASVLPNYRLIERPSAAGVVSPVPTKIYTTALIAVLLMFVLFVYFKEFSSKKILFRSQIEEYVPIPVISELIYYDHDLNNPIVVGEGKRTLIAEQFRELRTNINYITAAAKDRCKVILATSSIPQEGKSFVAINSAISLSLTGDKVVLLEFDLRKPKISKPLGITSDPGLSNFFVGKASVAEIIKPHSTIPHLFVIPSGPIPPNPAELMSGEKLGELFVALKEQFDYIVIDSPPVAAVTDAKILAPFADAVLYIVRHNYTNFVFLNLLVDIFQKKSLNNINIVFNGIKNKRIMGYGYGGYGYGYGYNYGYGYTVEEKKKKSLRNFFKKAVRKK